MVRALKSDKQGWIGVEFGPAVCNHSRLPARMSHLPWETTAMLTIYGQRHGGYCDSIGRRDFLTIGGMALSGLALPQILRAEAADTNPTRKRGSTHKAIINVYLPGGPPHIDMWDLKPDAPAEIRGEFS